MVHTMTDLITLAILALFPLALATCYLYDIIIIRRRLTRLRRDRAELEELNRLLDRMIK